DADLGVPPRDARRRADGLRGGHGALGRPDPAPPGVLGLVRDTHPGARRAPPLTRRRAVGDCWHSRAGAEPTGPASAASPRAHRKRPGSKGRSTSGGWPEAIRWAIASPVAGARPRPSMAWPLATNRFSKPGSAPITGKPSGVTGRSPAQGVAFARLRGQP